MAASRGDHASIPCGTLLHQRYKIQKECGCGNFSKVFMAVDTKCDNKPVAVKLLKKEYAADAAFERDILKGLGDRDKQAEQKVTKMLDYFVYNRHPTFVFPLKGPSLRSCKLGVTRGNVPASEMKAFAFEMLHVLKFLHQDVKMVHTDLKPENILLDASLASGATGIGKAWTVCDFGSASFVRPDRMDSDLISTRPYRAPEVVMGNGWTTTADIWSMACVLFEVQAGSRLFEIHDDTDHLHAFEARMGEKLPQVYRKTSKHSTKFFGTDGSIRRPSTKAIRPMSEVLKETPELHDLLKCMLEFDPKKRISASEALLHPYFKGCSKAAQEAAEAAAAPVLKRKESSPPAATPDAAALPLRARSSSMDNAAAGAAKPDPLTKVTSLPVPAAPAITSARVAAAKKLTRDIVPAGKPSYGARQAVGRFY